MKNVFLTRDTYKVFSACLFSFCFSTNTSTKRTSFVTIKPVFPKGKIKLTKKQIDTLEKYVVKIHSTALNTNRKVHPFVIRSVSLLCTVRSTAFFNLQNGRKIKLSREIGPGSAIRCTCQRYQARGFFKILKLKFKIWILWDRVKGTVDSNTKNYLFCKNTLWYCDIIKKNHFYWNCLEIEIKPGNRHIVLSLG